MSTKGFEVVVKSGPLTDERLEHVYTSLSSNWMFCSLDMALDEDENEITFLFGVQMSEGLDSDELAQGVIEDALSNAFGNTTNETLPEFHTVGVFA
jgi:hypothetical protein